MHHDEDIERHENLHEPSYQRNNNHEYRGIVGDSNEHNFHVIRTIDFIVSFILLFFIIILSSEHNFKQDSLTTIQYLETINVSYNFII